MRRKQLEQGVVRSQREGRGHRPDDKTGDPDSKNVATAQRVGRATDATASRMPDRPGKDGGLLAIGFRGARRGPAAGIVAGGDKLLLVHDFEPPSSVWPAAGRWQPRRTLRVLWFRIATAAWWKQAPCRRPPLYPVGSPEFCRARGRRAVARTGYSSGGPCPDENRIENEAIPRTPLWARAKRPAPAAGTEMRSELRRSQLAPRGAQERDAPGQETPVRKRDAVFLHEIARLQRQRRKLDGFIVHRCRS